MLAPLLLGTLSYLGTDVHDTDPRPLIRDSSRIMEFDPVGRSVLERSLNYDPETGFEDMYLAEAGLSGGAGGIATRNELDFAPAELVTYYPAELVRMVS